MVLYLVLDRFCGHYLALILGLGVSTCRHRSRWNRHYHRSLLIGKTVILVYNSSLQFVWRQQRLWDATVLCSPPHSVQQLQVDYKWLELVVLILKRSITGEMECTDVETVNCRWDGVYWCWNGRLQVRWSVVILEWSITGEMECIDIGTIDCRWDGVYWCEFFPW